MNHLACFIQIAVAVSLAAAPMHPARAGNSVSSFGVEFSDCVESIGVGLAPTAGVVALTPSNFIPVGLGRRSRRLWCARQIAPASRLTAISPRRAPSFRLALSSFRRSLGSGTSTTTRSGTTRRTRSLRIDCRISASPPNTLRRSVTTSTQRNWAFPTILPSWFPTWKPHTRTIRYRDPLGRPNGLLRGNLVATNVRGDRPHGDQRAGHRD